MRPVNPVNVVYFNLQPPVLMQAGTDLIASLNDSSLIYTWRMNGSIIPGVNGPIFPFSQSGCYSVTATTMAGDSAISDTLCITVSGLTEVMKHEKLILAPNPGSGDFRFELPASFSNQDYVATVYNSQGKLIWSKEMQYTSSEAMIRIDNPGLYLVQLMQDGKIARGSVVVQ
jgi:hypothetical protein